MARAIVKTFQPEFPVGSVMTSMLDEATFQAENGTGWVLADGRSVVGDDYQTLTAETNIPDLRGQFLRGKDYGAGNNPSDLALGAAQGEEVKAHRHSTMIRGSGNNNSLWHFDPTGGNRAYASAAPGDGTGGYYNNYMQDTGGAETRPKNVTVNYFIKINN